MTSNKYYSVIVDKPIQFQESHLNHKSFTVNSWVPPLPTINYMQVKTDYSYVSTDGITWSGNSMPSGQWKSVERVGSTFVAVASDGTNRIATTTDGFNWIVRATSASGLFLYKVLYNSTIGLYIAVGHTLSGLNVVPAIRRSTNGTTWLTSTVSNSENSTLFSLGNRAGQMIALPINGGFTAGWITSDGINWTKFTRPGGTPRGITETFTGWVMVGDSYAATSTNGTSWTLASIPSGSWNDVVSIVPFSSTPFAIGGYTQSQDNGATFTNQSGGPIGGQEVKSADFITTTVRGIVAGTNIYTVSVNTTSPRTFTFTLRLLNTNTFGTS